MVHVGIPVYDCCDMDLECVIVPSPFSDQALSFLSHTPVRDVPVSIVSRVCN